MAPDEVDYEAELTIVIGKRAKNVEIEEAEDYILVIPVLMMFRQGTARFVWINSGPEANLLIHFAHWVPGLKLRLPNPIIAG